MKYVVLIICTLCFVACQKKQPEGIVKNRKDLDMKCKRIIVQPFDGFPTKMTDSLFIQIKKINPVAILRKPIPLPPMAYYKERKRYRADSLLNYLWMQRNGSDVIIGLTNVDISTTKDKNEDWGIMGLAYKPGYSCVVSTFRLSKKNTQEQLYKLSLHELAHTRGLPHCRRDSACYMSDANGTNPWDSETRFCHRCKAFLKRRGWILN